MIGPVDCDDAMLLIARRDERTLTGQEIARLGVHVDSCAECTQLAAEADAADWAWIARVPGDAFDDLNILTLPTVDPAVFDIEGTIARGGMGQIIKARDRRLGRTIAIKEVIGDGLGARFEREAMITARLQHPAIVPIYEAGMWPNGSAFYTMRLVSGETLSAAIKDGESLAERLTLLPNVLAATEAIAYAHSEGVIHRDLKPHNILVGDFGETVVIDWGLAKVLGEREELSGSDPLPILRDLTLAGEILGTPCFIAPEQAATQSPDARSDVYSLGAILYTLLTGTPPYLDKYPEATALRLVDVVTQERPTPIATLEPQTPPDLLAIVETAMAHEPGDRYPSAEQLASELRRFEAGQLIASKHYTLRELLGRWLRRHRSVLTVAALAAAALIAVGVVAFVNTARSRDDAERARDVAVSAQQQSEARAIELVFRQAQDSLTTDPTRTLAWLKQYPESGSRSTAAALLAAEATSRGVHRHVFDAQGDEIPRLQFVAGDRMLLATSHDHPARVWNLQTGAAFDLATMRREDVYYDEPSNEFLAPDERGSRIRFETFGAPEKARDGPEIGTGSGGGQSLAFDAGTRIAAFERAPDRHIMLWNQQSATLTEFGARGWPVAFLDRGRLLLVFDDDDWSLEMWDVASATEAARIRVPDGAAVGARYGIATSPGQSPAVAVRLNGLRGVLLWRFNSQDLIPLAAHRQISAMAFSPDGNALALGDTSGGIEIFDVAAAKTRCRWGGGSYRVTALEYASDRVGPPTVAVGLRSGHVVIAGECGELERRLRGHSEEVTAVAFSADSSRVASASEDQSVRVHVRSPLLSPGVAMAPTPVPPSGCERPEWVYPRKQATWFYCDLDSDDRLYIRQGPDGVSQEARFGKGSNSYEVISGDGNTIAVNGLSSVSVWRSGSRKELATKLTGESRLSFDGATLYQPTGTALETWDVDGQKLAATLDQPVTVAVPSPDSTALAVDAPDGAAVIDGDGTARGGSHVTDSDFVRWSPDSRAVGFIVGSGTLLVYERTTRRWSRLSTGTSLEMLAVSAARQLAVAAASDRRTIVISELGSGVSHSIHLPRTLHADHISIAADGALATVHGMPDSATVKVPEFSASAVAQITQVVINDRGDARTPPPSSK